MDLSTIHFISGSGHLAGRVVGVVGGWIRPRGRRGRPAGSSRGGLGGGRRAGAGWPFSIALLDSFGHDPEGLPLIVLTGREGDFMALAREARGLDRQGQVMELFVKSLVTLQVRTLVG